MSVLKRTCWLIGFAISMGYLETAVVIYLRQLYYPNGFQFPLVVLSPEIGVVEILREAATIIMLLSVGVLASTNTRQRIAFFLIVFAIWDLSYYLFLKLFLDWPSSFLTWDILFLIPAPWVGPILSPVIICCIMIAFATVLLKIDGSVAPTEIKWQNWLLIIAGCLVVIMSWMWDYIQYSGRITDSPSRALETLTNYVPVEFNWFIFATGAVLLIAGIATYWRQSLKKKNNRVEASLS